MPEAAPHVLVVDDDAPLRLSMVRVLRDAGFEVSAAPEPLVALDILREGKRFDAIVTDLRMPGMDGVEFLRHVRRVDLDVPLIVLTGFPTLESAIATVRYGGFRYLDKPVGLDTLVDTVREATAMHRLAVLKRRALELYEAEGWLLGDRAGIADNFDRALDKLWLAFQPIVDWNTQRIFGYEALVRSSEPTLGNPGVLFDAAERLGRVRELGRRIRRLLAEHASHAPSDVVLFTNLHSADLNDEDLFSPDAPMTHHASRIVLEITERSSLDRVPDVRSAIQQLRNRGFRIAVDDLGAGYAGLSSFSQLEPDIAKLDMSLVRGIDQSPRKASLVRSIIEVCTRDLGTMLVCEGVETEAERDTLLRLGADLLQGYLLGRPEPKFRASQLL